jgi:Flp pilus assembly protein TadD/glutathione synthase/RimK-type ligase-like ATP-grasp enzyme
MTNEHWRVRLTEARELHRAGQLVLARPAYETLLDAVPEDVEVRGLLGVLALQEDRIDDAEALLRQAVAGGGDACVHLRNLNNLLALLQRTGDVEAARNIVAEGLPGWPEGAVPDASERQTVLSLCGALLLLDQAPAARALLERAIPEPNDDAEALGLAGRVLLALGEAAPAAVALERAVKLAPDDCELLIALSYAQDQLGQRDEANASMKTIVRLGSVYAAPSSPSQRATILVLNPAPRNVRNPGRGISALHFAVNFPTQFAATMQDEFQFHSIFADVPATNLPRSLPRADVILNNCADPETINVPGRLENVVETMERAGAPVINDPRAVFATTRQKVAPLLAGIPNLKIPRIERYRTDLSPAAEIAADIEGRFDYPVIIRRCQAHTSARLQHSLTERVTILAEDGGMLRDTLATVTWPEIYAIEYVPLRKKSGHFRMVRAVLAEDDVIIANAGFTGDWMASNGRGRQNGIDYYRAHPETIDESRQIILDPERCLGADCLRTLETIRDRMPMDLFGVDFDVDDAGKVVFFEANAAMNLLKRAHEPEDVTLPDAPFERIKTAFRRAVDRRIGSAGQADAPISDPLNDIGAAKFGAIQAIDL